MLRSAWALGVLNASSIPGGADLGTSVNVPSRAPPACAGVKVQGRLGPAFGMCPGTQPHHNAHDKKVLFFSQQAVACSSGHPDQNPTLEEGSCTFCSPQSNHHLCPSSLGDALHATAWRAGLQGTNIQTWSAESSFTEICKAFLQAYLSLFWKRKAVLQVLGNTEKSKGLGQCKSMRISLVAGHPEGTAAA